MRRLGAVIIGWMLAVCACRAGAQAELGADRDVLKTLVAGLSAREANCPPLTMWGIWRAFYTPLHWTIAGEIVSDHDGFKRMVKGDRAAVALAYWESADSEEWEREFQGVYRGPNQWVYPAFPADALIVSDLHRVERATRDRLLVLDTSVNGYPWITVKPVPSLPGREFLGRWLGLDGGVGPLSENLAEYARPGAWRLAALEYDGGRFVVRRGWYNPARNDASEVVIELDSEHGFAATRYRHVAVVAGRGRSARELQWRDLREVGGQGVFLAAAATRWEFEYSHPGVPPLVNTQTFTCSQLAATDPKAPRPSLPRCAVYEDLGVVAVPGADVAQCIAATIWALRRGFAEAQPPPPPDDLMRLSTTDALAQIKARYGFK